jgi:hypothetical protein
MLKRKIDEETLKRVVEEGEIKRKSDVDMWAFKHIEGRTDNLLCAAVVESGAVIIKTVMINWELEDEA